MRGRLIGIVASLLLLAAQGPRDARANAVVGTGSPASCTDAALNTALGIGGTITFNCGADPVTINLQSQKTISGAVVLNGADRITLSGHNALRPFLVPAGAQLGLNQIIVANGLSAGDGGCIHNSGTLSLTAATVDGCSAGNDGGGIFNAAGGSASLDNSMVSNCTANRDCGGVCTYGTTLVVDNCLLEGNVATTRNAGGLGMVAISNQARI